MLNFTISVGDTIDQFPAIAALEERKIKKAVVRAANKTARWARAQAASDVSEKLDIKISIVRKEITTQRANTKNLQATVGLRKKAGVVNAFNLGVASQDRRGTRVGRRQFDHAFIATMPSGHRGIFRRKGKERLPIDEVRIILTSKLKDAISDIENGEGPRQFQRILERELRAIARTG